MSDVKNMTNVSAGAAAIAQVLRRTSGLEVELVGAWTVERMLAERMAALHSDAMPMNAMLYAQRIEVDAEERQRLIEAIVVPETWFFRHRQAYDFVAQLAQRRLSGVDGFAHGPLRLASLPCSTGEEPYSLAMCLLDAGMPVGSFVIDAVDISAASIETARSGFYRRNAFRGEDLAFRARYFQPCDDGWQINPVLKQCVDFRTGNLVDDSAYRTPAYYDVVFCRNVLIYFDRPTQQSVMSRLFHSLRDNAHLFVGPAESGIASRAGLAPSAAPLAFAFHRAVAPPAASVMPLALSEKTTWLRTVTRPAAVAAAVTLTRPSSAGAATALKPAMAVSTASAGSRSIASQTSRWQAAMPAALAATAAVRNEPTLARAEALANRGQLAEAEALCRTLLTRTEPDAELYALMGMIADASGRADEARAHLRRALYLDATHAGALLQLAGHLTTDGDAAGAERLLARARRARPDLF